jgi:hypothetical protein
MNFTTLIYVDFAIAALLIILNGGLSISLQLNLER